MEKNLCGAGVAFKLIQALLPSMGWPAEKVRRVSESCLKLAAIATVADVVPLTGENRIIVSHGLRGLDKVRNVGLRALLDVAGFTDGAAPSAHQVGFQIGPRINAAGRMDTASAVIELFLTNDPARARDLAKQLDDQNSERQQVQAEIVATCEQIAVDPAECALVYYSGEWHRGVLGIVASRLAERLGRPVFVLGRNPDDGLASGSGRSIPAFHLLDALESMSELFVRFGGHAHAAGLTMEVAGVEEFRRRFHAFAASRLCADDFLRRLEIDAVLELREISEQAVNEIFTLAPVRSRQSAAAVRRAGRGSGRTAHHHEGEAPEDHCPPERADARAQGVEPCPPGCRTGARGPGGRGLQSGRGRVLGCQRLSALGRNAAGFPARLKRR